VRLGAYGLLAALGVTAVVAFWSGIDRPEPREPAPTASSSEDPAVPATDGLTVPEGSVVEADDGQRYESPWVYLAYDVLVVQVTMRAPDGEGRVEVAPPRTQVLAAGAPLERIDDPDATETADAGALAAATASFDAERLEVGDTVTVRLTASDGSRFDFADVVVEERPGAR
jgi:hypothetical protein